ncbi:unknown [Clostridium sp. CAG:448]|nr:unknown [Clostridium sp. CAG:448]
MPGACARGRLDKSPINTVPMTAESAVVTYMASKDTVPRFSNMPALTTRMYAMARKVVSPARISVLSEDPIWV